MKNSDWKTYAEMVGITALVISLLFLAMQLKQAQDIARSEINASQHASIVELNIAIADHGDVWVRGNAGSNLDPAEMTAYRRLLDALAHQYRIEWRDDLLFKREVEGMISPALKFAVFLYENPGAREVWVADRERVKAVLHLLNRDFETPRFAALVFDWLERLDERSN